MKLILGIPKGSLQEKTIELFKKAGFNIVASKRSYYPATNDPELEVILVRAQEMARFVENKVMDAGLTGKDWILETKARVKEVAELDYAKQGLGRVRWVIAVPQNSNIKSVKDLNGKTIATELVNVTKEFLKKRKVKARVEFSWGATEAKCPKLADAIVELTETGRSLKENNLREIETVLESTTRLIANKEAWKNKWKKEKILSIKMLLESVLLAEKKAMLEMNVNKKNFKKLIKILPCMKSPTVSKLFGEEGYAVKVAVNKEDIPKIIPKIKKAGATDILEFELEKVVV
jgi:ATP phosphoribosyltransferase